MILVVRLAYIFLDGTNSSGYQTLILIREDCLLIHDRSFRCFFIAKVYAPRIADCQQESFVKKKKCDRLRASFKSWERGAQ